MQKQRREENNVALSQNRILFHRTQAPCKRDELLMRARSMEDIDSLQDLLKNRYQFDGQVIDHQKLIMHTE